MIESVFNTPKMASLTAMRFVQNCYSASCPLLKESDLTQQPPARKDAETLLGMLLFGLGMGLFSILLTPSGAAGFIIGFIAGLLLAGGLDLIIHSTRL